VKSHKMTRNTKSIDSFIWLVFMIVTTATQREDRLNL